MNEKRVKVPMFELVGPPCKNEDCDGVLIDTISWKSDQMYKVCSKCNEKFFVSTIKEGMEYAIRTIERVYKGEKEN